MTPKELGNYIEALITGQPPKRAFYEIRNAHPRDLYESYEEAVEKAIDGDPDYQGEEGLMRAYEDYAERFVEVVIDGQTF